MGLYDEQNKPNGYHRLIELVGGRGNIATVSHCILVCALSSTNRPMPDRKKLSNPHGERLFHQCRAISGGDWHHVGDYYQALIASTGQAQVDKSR